MKTRSSKVVGAVGAGSSKSMGPCNIEEGQTNFFKKELGMAKKVMVKPSSESFEDTVKQST